MIHEHFERISNAGLPSGVALRRSGFTLLELLLVILITGILAVVVAPIIQQPIRAYFDQTTRAALVDAADAALRRIARDGRRALPYSTRVDVGGDAVEFIVTRDGARYRPWSAGGPAGRRLRIGQNETSFNILGTFSSIGARPYVLGTGSPHERLVIFNLGTTGYNAYAGDSVITGSGVAITIDADGNEDNIALSPGHQFDTDSTSRRVYIADGGVSYACHNGGLYRRSGYGYEATQASAAAVASDGVMITGDVVSCSFEHDPGTSFRPELLIMTIELSRHGETVTLLHQLHISNAT